MPALDRSVKVTCGNCGTSVTKNHLSPHKSNCIGGTLYSPKCPNFSFKSGDNCNYHFAKKHSATRPKNNHTCKKCSIESPSFFPCDTTNNIITQQKLSQVEKMWKCKVLRTQEMTKAWKKSYSRVDISWLIKIHGKGDIMCSTLLSTTLQLKLSKKNWIAFWIN